MKKKILLRRLAGLVSLVLCASLLLVLQMKFLWIKDIIVT